MSFRHFFAALVLALTSSFAAAQGTASATFTTNIQFTSGCQISTGAMGALGMTVRAFDSVVYTSGFLSFECSAGLTPVVGIRLQGSGTTTPPGTPLQVTDQALNLPYTVTMTRLQQAGYHYNVGLGMTGSYFNNPSAGCPSGTSCDNSNSTNRTFEVVVAY